MLAIAGSAAGVLVWQLRANQAPARIDVTGFDMAAAPKSAHVALPPVDSAPARPAPSGLNMVTKGEGIGIEAKPAAAATPGAGLNEAARRSGARVSAFTARFRRAHPIMAQYSREWMSRPDLKKLNDDYMRDHDLLRFARGLTAAPSFKPLVKKIMSDPRSQPLAMEFVTGLVKETPPDLMSAAASVVNDEKTVKGLINTVAEAVGVPLSLVPGMGVSGGSVDANKIMQQAQSAAGAAPR